MLSPLDDPLAREQVFTGGRLRFTPTPPTTPLPPAPRPIAPVSYVNPPSVPASRVTLAPSVSASPVLPSPPQAPAPFTMQAPVAPAPFNMPVPVAPAAPDLSAKPLAAQAVRATGHGFDPAYLQNLAVNYAATSVRPDVLEFDPRRVESFQQALGVRTMGGGNAPTLGAPVSLLEKALAGMRERETKRGEYQKQVEAYNRDVSNYGQARQAYQAAVDKYNRDVAAYQQAKAEHDRLVAEYNKKLAEYNKQAAAAKAAPPAPAPVTVTPPPAPAPIAVTPAPTPVTSPPQYPISRAASSYPSYYGGVPTAYLGRRPALL